MNEQPDFVRNKIRASTPKDRGPVTHARAKRREIIKLAEKLIDMLEPYRKEAIQVWIDGMRATKPIYEKGIRVGEEPDWKERRENAALIIAYLEGKPIEKQIQAHGDFEDLGSLLEAMKHSPASQASLQKTVEGREIPPALADAATEEGSGPRELKKLRLDGRACWATCLTETHYKAAKMLRTKNHPSTAAAVKMSLLRKPKGKELLA
jgi:hypothetical protein